MIVLLRYLVGWLVGVFRSHEDLVFENLALRQQLVALHARRPRRRLAVGHQLFWVVLRRLWPRWRGPLILVTPRTVVRWHRAGFRLYWKWLSRAKPQGGRKPVTNRTAFRSPWQNGVAERWVGSVRRELLDHGIVINQRHLRRLLKEYIRYYHEDRTHLGLGKDTPAGRVRTSAPSNRHKVISLPRLDGLHHRYIVAA
jgi:putative transposase